MLNKDYGFEQWLLIQRCSSMKLYDLIVPFWQKIRYIRRFYLHSVLQIILFICHLMDAIVSIRNTVTMK
jgi:hypothetical protein